MTIPKLKQLRKTCLAQITAFERLGDVEQTPHGPLIHIDRGSKVLAVAHLDHVVKTRPVMRDTVISCGQLDDRLGAWVILFLLPYLGINVDVLLTDSEETGQSTAQYFVPPKDYNWVVEFDRRGTDVVLYQYDSPSNRELLEEAGFSIGVGSFSDISYLDIGVSGFNIGVGYHNEHTRFCYADLRDTIDNVALFADFYRLHADTLIPAPRFDDGYSADFDHYNLYGDGWRLPESDSVIDDFDLFFS